MSIRRFLIGVALVFVFFPVLAAPDISAPTVAKIISGDTLVLSDGRTLRLEGIKAPEPKALADQATTYLKSLVADHSLTLENASIDRYGRTCTEIYIAQDGGKKIWLQGEMLHAGFAFIYPPADNEPHLAEMFKLESEARHAGHGIWADPTYAEKAAEKAAAKYGRFAFVTGTVLDTARVKNMVYLNFGADWKTDFTIAIAAHDLKNFRQADIDPLTYKGKNIRVRGWVKRDFGPMITVTSPNQIEILNKN